MARMELSALDSQQAQDLLEDLVQLKESRAWQLVQARLELLLNRDQRLLELADPTESLKLYQGRVRAEREVLSVIDDLVNELRSYTNQAGLVAGESE